MEFQRVTKIGYQCKYRYPKLGTEIYNRLENINIITNEEEPIVITGVLGEYYTISMETLTSRYLNLDGSKIELQDYTEEEIDIKTDTSSNNVVWAKKWPVDSDFTIITMWGNKHRIISHGLKDNELGYILHSDDNGKPSAIDQWIIDREAFNLTYRFVEESKSNSLIKVSTSFT